MHDGPVRMLAKGTLRGIVPWRQARAFFAARLRRRLTEEALVKHIAGGWAVRLHNWQRPYPAMRNLGVDASASVISRPS